MHRGAFEEQLLAYAVILSFITLIVSDYLDKQQSLAFTRDGIRCIAAIYAIPTGVVSTLCYPMN